MKITKSQLKRIIKEELKAVLNEFRGPSPDPNTPELIRKKTPEQMAKEKDEAEKWWAMAGPIIKGLATKLAAKAKADGLGRYGEDHFVLLLKQASVKGWNPETGLNGLPDDFKELINKRTSKMARAKSKIRKSTRGMPASDQSMAMMMGGDQPN